MSTVRVPRKCDHCGIVIPPKEDFCVNTDCYNHKIQQLAKLQRNRSTFSYVKFQYKVEEINNEFAFKEVKDETFHAKHRHYLEAKRDLEQYIIDQAKLEEEEIGM